MLIKALLIKIRIIDKVVKNCNLRLIFAFFKPFDYALCLNFILFILYTVKLKIRVIYYTTVGCQGFHEMPLFLDFFILDVKECQLSIKWAVHITLRTKTVSLKMSAIFSESVIWRSIFRMSAALTFFTLHYVGPCVGWKFQPLEH